MIHFLRHDQFAGRGILGHKRSGLDGRGIVTAQRNDIVLSVEGELNLVGAVHQIGGQRPEIVETVLADRRPAGDVALAIDGNELGAVAGGIARISPRELDEVSDPIRSSLRGNRGQVDAVVQDGVEAGVAGLTGEPDCVAALTLQSRAN